MTNQTRNWRQLAEEASVENDPRKLISLIRELNEALARERPRREKAVARLALDRDREVSENPASNPAQRELAPA